MDWEPIKKSRDTPGPRPILADYDASCRDFTWTAAENDLDHLPDGGLNIAYEAVDRHVAHGHGNKVAIRWLARDGGRVEFTYTDLQEQTNRFANVLRQLGVSQGERVFSLAGRVPELYIAVLGTLKNGGVYCPLFSAFGPEPIAARMTIGNAKVLVTTVRLYRQKVEKLRPRLPELQHVLLIDVPADAQLSDGVHSLPALMTAADTAFTIAPTQPEDMALLHFTSGTTGKPKGAVHVHAAVIAHHATARFALDLRPEDVFWCTADPGWVTGTSYGIIGPLSVGTTMLVDEQDFDAERWYRTLQDEQVTVWYTAPTAIRMMMKYGSDLPQSYDLSRLRFIASVGEPLNPEAVVWGREALGLPIHDNWWQTETGGIMIANYASMDIKPGSMGKPLPGVEAGIVEHQDDGSVREITEPDVQGELALRPGWPSMFRAYLGEQARYEKCFAGGWYLSGDLARRDGDGYFWFVGRADDVIKTSGHMVGPFEVESALMEHPAVAEVGVIGKPDPVAMEIVKAFVALKPGYKGDDALRRDLLAHARRRLGAAVAPKEIEFTADLPKTRSGKIMRRLLKARELGLPEGDTSTLERSQ
jgi:acetyl-CoA synthetase